MSQDQTSMMGAQKLFEDEFVRITFTPGESAGDAIVSFTGIGLKLGVIQQEEFSRSLSAQRDVYFVTDIRRSWFNDCAPQILRVLSEHMAQRGTRNVTTLGNSMGGSGAMLFARDLPNCRTAIAFVPQSSIHNDIAPFEIRYQDFARKVETWRVPDVAACLSDDVTYHVFTGSLEPRDLLHAARFLEAAPNSCNIYAIRDADHNAGRDLKARGIAMSDVIAAACNSTAQVRHLLRDHLIKEANSPDQLRALSESSGKRPAMSDQAPSKDIRNELELQVFGLQRSGNHGIIGWITQQFPEKVYFFNNVSHFEDPVTNWHVGAVPNTVAINKKATERLQAIRERKKEVVICSYENLRLNQLAKRPVIPNRAESFGTSRRTLQLLLLRDFFNWLSSRLKLFDYRGQDTDAAVRNVDGLIDLWLMYAREFSGQTRFMSGNDVVKISYPRWVVDVEYRAWILGAVGAPLTDNSNNHVPDVGGGSSFDTTALSGRASDMAVQQRWSFFLEDDRFAFARARVAERRSEIEPLNKAIFDVPWVL